MVNRPDGLQVAMLPCVPRWSSTSTSARPSVPALVADEAEPQALDLGGDDRDDRRGRHRRHRCRCVGSVGLLSDIRTSAAGSGPTVPSAEVQIVAAAGTPQAVLDQVAEATGTSWRTSATVRDALGESYGGAQSVAYALTALACALVALLALGAGVARHLRDYRRDVASLRVLGISVGTARRAGRAELVSLTLLVLAIVVAGGWLAVTLLLGGLPLLVAPGRRHCRSTPRRTSWPLVDPGGARGRRGRARRRPRPRGPRLDHPAQPAARGGGQMNSPHDLLLLRSAPRTTSRGPEMIQLLGAIVRGLRSRALLSAGSVLLTALAIGSAVLGPVFSEAVTNSYVVTRLQETPPGLTGLSRVFTPDSGAGPRAGRARRRRRVRRR